ncbi:MAG TPA: class I SAM-dependent methyltransferase [Bacteroidota bacterium]|nr:class I SAM-dependent methyltransferase [Bacteroidota bacterium]
MEQQQESMRLGKIEFAAMNNPLREWRMKHQEFPLLHQMLQKHQIDLTGRRLVDMGCGSGYSTILLLQQFSPSHLTAFDIMPEQIALARKRNLNIDFNIGDATAIDIPDASCDAVFDFGILHHIPLWRKALSESARVLTGGGIMFIEEPHKLFEWDEFEEGIQNAGFTILERKQWYFGFFRFFLAQKQN